MQDITTKTEGSQLTADEFNQIPAEIENAIISTGQTLTSSNLEQLATSLAIYSSKGDFYSTSGTANAISLSPISSMKPISSYSLGTKVRFIANSNNTDVVTIAISNLTSVNLLNSSGSPLVANELLQDYEYTATFDGTNFRLVSNYNSVQAQLDIKANDSEVVHLTNNETIAGVKTFSSSPIVPDVTTGDSSTNSANTKFVTTAVTNLQNQVNNSFVNLTGSQNITGSKTFTGTLGIPSDNLITKQDNKMEGGQINFEKPTNSSLTGNANIDIYGNRMRFLGRNSSNNYTTPLFLDLETNIAFATASDSLNSVITTTGISKSENGFVKLGNGLVVQWGWHSGSGSTLTFPTPFTSTNYSVTANYRKQSSSGSGIGHVNFYPTSTTSCYFNSQGGDFQWIAIGY